MKPFPTFIVLFIGLEMSAAILFQRAPAPRLGTYNVDHNSLTVSGISSGGMMSAQFHFIYSSEVKGSGIFAGGPYLCGYGGPADASVCMLTPWLQNVAWFIAQANTLALSGQIQSPTNLRNSKVYIFHGSEDSVVSPLNGEHLRQMYANYVADIHTEFNIPAGHGQPVDGNGYGGPCGSTNILNEFINECGYNGAYEMFRHLYGANITRPEKDYVEDGELLSYDQNEFFAVDPILSSMSRTGLVYVPKACKDGQTQCRLHIAFHGCMANEHMIGDSFATKTQYIEVASLNNIIVLFPQTTASVLNPVGCWDWFGYTGLASFATKVGNQPFAVRKMAYRVMGK